MIRSCFAVPVFLVLLSACAKNPAASAAAPDQAAAPALAASGDSYELVQLERPESLNTLIRASKVVYDLCVIGAQAANKPVKPWPVIPDDFSDKKITTITNGKSIMIKTETFYATGGEMKLEDGCAMEIKREPAVQLQIQHAGKMIDMAGEKGAAPQVLGSEDIPAMPYASQPDDTSDYSEARSVNGVPLRCLPKTHFTMIEGSNAGVRETCVYATDGVLVDTERKAIVLRSHTYITLTSDKESGLTKLEPLSVRRIGSNEPNPYSPATYSR